MNADQTFLHGTRIRAARARGRGPGPYGRPILGVRSRDGQFRTTVIGEGFETVSAARGVSCADSRKREPSFDTSYGMLTATPLAAGNGT